MSERVLIVGAGHVGRGLFRAFRAATGVDVLGLHGRKSSSYTTSAGALPPATSDANTIIVAVRDEQIDDVLEDLIRQRAAGSRARIASGTVVVHTSGSAEPQMMAALAEVGLSGGTFHPLVPFANPDHAAELLKHAWIGIDGDDQARATSRRLAGHLGARTIDIPAGSKAKYHAAAVMASNFPVVLAALAGELLGSLGIAERSAQMAVQSLMQGAVSNLAESSPAEALTGPVARGDTATVIAHLSALRNHAEARAVYKRMSLAALDLAQGSIDPSAVSEIRKVLLLR